MNVNEGQFGLLYSYAVDGSIQAQPLCVPNLRIGAGTFNALFVVTMNDVIYAFNADSSSPSGGVLWSRDLRNPGAGVTAIPITDIVAANSLNIVGNVGIESTPVIDLASQTMYLVARTKEVSGSATNYLARLHALDITTGSEKFSGPVAIGGSVHGTGQGSSNGSLTFDPFIQNQRSSLALVNGTIVFSWASHEDYFDWHGWIFAFNVQTLKQAGIYCSTPNGKEGSIWMAGCADRRRQWECVLRKRERRLAAWCFSPIIAAWPPLLPPSSARAGRSSRAEAQPAHQDRLASRNAIWIVTGVTDLRRSFVGLAGMGYSVRVSLVPGSRTVIPCTSGRHVKIGGNPCTRSAG